MKTKLAKMEMEQFLDIKCSKIAYLLGFIWADGYICKDSARILMNKEDSNYIKPIIDSSGEWSVYINPNKSRPLSWKESILFVKNSRILTSFLKENDYCEKSFKSPDKILSKIPENLKHYWWRGYFDGDGCINLTSKHRRASICSTYEQDWKFVKDLASELNFNFAIEKTKRINKSSGNENKYSKIHIQNLRSLNLFLFYVYEGYETDNIGFKRKYDKWVLIKNHTEKRDAFIPSYIHYSKSRKTWQANYKKIYIGTYKTREEAVLGQKNYLMANSLKLEPVLSLT
mgnify:CR=1 FL=1